MLGDLQVLSPPLPETYSPGVGSRSQRSKSKETKLNPAGSCNLGSGQNQILHTPKKLHVGIHGGEWVIAPPKGITINYLLLFFKTSTTTPPPSTLSPPPK